MINCKDLQCAKRNSDNNSNNNNDNNNMIQIIVYENMLRFYGMWQYSASGYLISARLCTLIVRVPEAALLGLWYLLNINFCFPCICVKSVQIRIFFWSLFSCIWTEYGPEKIPYLDNFHVVCISHLRYSQYWDDEFPVQTTTIYLEPCQTFMMEAFCQQLKAVNNHRCLTGL